MPDISLSLALLKKPIEQVLGLATGKTKEKIERLKAESKIKTIYQKLNSTQKVKTIWDVDRARSLSSFYYPAKIRTSSGARQQLNSLNELSTNAIVLSGTVGQGKSILLRHMLSKEIKSGERIPLFVELRKVPLEGLQAYLRTSFDELMGTSSSPEIFQLFAEAGKISFLLDGFDEIDPDRAQDVMSSIDSLASRFPNSKLIVTSRPGSGIETSPQLDVVHIAPLTDSDFAGFFNKILSRDRALAAMICSAVMQSNSVKEMASTPLLATLLTIVYRSTQKIPTDFSEFYDQLFQILLVRHDRSKAYTRKRKTTLGDREMQQGFEAYCYRSHASGLPVVSKVTALETSKLALAARELNAKEDAFLEDVIKVTCLLQEEGGNIEFVHQSVREFYAAKYIASRPEETAKKFYTKLREGRNWRKWDQVISFLSQLDKYRASQYYLIPTARDFLKSVQSEGIIAAAPRLRELLSDTCGVRKNPKKVENDKQSSFLVYRNQTDANPYRDLFNDRIYLIFFGPNGIGAGKWSSAFDKTTLNQSKTFTEIAIHCGKLNELDKFLTDFVTEIKVEVVTLQGSATVVESSDEFMSL